MTSDIRRAGTGRSKAEVEAYAREVDERLAFLRAQWVAFAESSFMHAALAQEADNLRAQLARMRAERDAITDALAARLEAGKVRARAQGRGGAGPSNLPRVGGSYGADYASGDAVRSDD